MVRPLDGDVRAAGSSWATLNERCTAALQARNESLRRVHEMLNRHNALKRQLWLAVMWGVCIGFGIGLVVGLMF